MGETYEGITVPDGQPEDVTAAAARLDGTSGMVGGALARLNGLPGSMATWQGPASAAFAGTAQQQAAAARSAGQTIDTGVIALRDYAHVLHQAQHDAKHAIEQAKDANRRIHKAEAALATAQGEASAARTRAANATTQLHATGGAHPNAHADLSRAQSDEAEAERAERAARRQLEHAREDLRRAKHDGEEADRAARLAAQGLAAQMQGAAGGVMPFAAGLGGPATAATGGPGGIDFASLLAGGLFARKSISTAASIWSHSKWIKSGTPFWNAYRSWQALGPIEPGTLGYEAMTQAYEHFPTFNTGLAGRGLQRVLGDSRAGQWLGDAAKAGPVFRGLGIAGGVLSTGLDAKTLVQDGNPIDAFHRKGAGYVADVARTGFDVSSTAFLVAPTPVTAGAAVVTGVVWAGAEIYQHRQAIGHALQTAGTFVWDHSLPGEIWNNREAIGHALDSGVHVVKAAGTEIHHVIDSGIDTAEHFGSGVAHTAEHAWHDLTSWL